MRIATNQLGEMHMRPWLLACAFLADSAMITGCGTYDPAIFVCTAKDIVDASAVVECPNGNMTTIPGTVLSPDSDAPAQSDASNAGELDASPPASHVRRHVILLIGDGMGYAHQVAGSRYRYGTDRGLSFQSFPVQAFVTTWSVTAYNTRAAAAGAVPYSSFAHDPLLGYDPMLGGYAPYPMMVDPPGARDYFIPATDTDSFTDSAAAATAMSTGTKTLNGMVGIDPDGRALETSLERLKRVYGMATGVVTTAPFSDATPAGFVSHVPDRYGFQEIAHQMLTVTRPDVVIGAGVPGSTVDPRISEADMQALTTSPEYVYVGRVDNQDGSAALLAAAASAAQQKKKLWGAFGKDERGFEPPIAMDSPGYPGVRRESNLDPTLPQATIAALEVLSRNQAGFFLMVEQGAIDKFSHDSAYETMVGCVWELDDTVRTLIEYVDRPNDGIDWSNTTIFVLADHETNFLRFSEQPLGLGQLTDETAAGSARYSWGVGSHTNQLIALSAIGAYAHRVYSYTNVYPGRQILDNTSLFTLTMDASEQ